ncbi:MAG: hypothetical protein IPI67_13160 [Myxococcales bacterium]|nr:hypothetical protein [Myxococcales bacterium]
MKGSAWGVALGLLLLSSCGRDEKWAPTPDPPELAEIAELPLDELDSAQAETLCKAVLAHVDPCRTTGMHWPAWPSVKRPWRRVTARWQVPSKRWTAQV